jgi:hypothetical protein
MHICAEHRDAAADKKDAPAAAAAPAGTPGVAGAGVAAAGGSAAGGAAAPDIYSAGSGAAPAASAAADECHLGGSAEQAVAAIGLVAAVLGEEVGGDMARRLLDGILQVRLAPPSPSAFALFNHCTLCILYLTHFRNMWNSFTHSRFSINVFCSCCSLATLPSAASCQWLWPC